MSKCVICFNNKCSCNYNQGDKRGKSSKKGNKEGSKERCYQKSTIKNNRKFLIEQGF